MSLLPDPPEIEMDDLSEVSKTKEEVAPSTKTEVLEEEQEEVEEDFQELKSIDNFFKKSLLALIGVVIAALVSKFFI